MPNYPSERGFYIKFCGIDNYLFLNWLKKLIKLITQKYLLLCNLSLLNFLVVNSSFKLSDQDLPPERSCFYEILKKFHKNNFSLGKLIFRKVSK